MKAINLSKDLLSELCSQKHMSSTKIAKICHWSHRTVLNYLRKYEIPVRASGPIPRDKNPPPNDPVKQGYMLGLCASDIYAGHHWRQIKVQLSTSVPEMVELFKNTWGPYSSVRIYPTKNKFSDSVVSCYCLLHPQFSFLLNAKEIIPDDPVAFYAYFAGAIDGDGSIKPRRRGGTIRLHNTDRAWLEKIKAKLSLLSFHPTIHGKNGYFTLNLGKSQDVLMVGGMSTKFMKHEIKKKKLENVLREIKLTR